MCRSVSPRADSGEGLLRFLPEPARRRRNKQPSSSSSSSSRRPVEPVFQAIWADNKSFDEVLISKRMVQDHMPDKVLEALEKVRP